MPTGRTCGNCQNFSRIKHWRGKGRSGICNVYDFNCHVDSSYAKQCVKYAAKKHIRLLHIDYKQDKDI